MDKSVCTKRIQAYDSHFHFPSTHRKTQLGGDTIFFFKLPNVLDDRFRGQSCWSAAEQLYLNPVALETLVGL